MNSRISYSFLFLFFVTKLLCQDVIIKKDGSEIISKIYEVNSSNIKYFEFNDQKHKKLSIPKKEINKVIFQNGDVLKYNETLEKKNIDSSLILVIKEKVNIKLVKQLGDYLNFNLMAGAVINESNINRPYDNDTIGTHGAIRFRYLKANNQKKTGFNFGFNFVLGSSPYIKHVFGINYLQSNSEFNYRKTVFTPDSTITYNKTTISDLNVKNTVYFLNIVNGIRITLFKSLHIETNITINIPTRSKSHINGSRAVHESGKSDTYYFIKDSTSSKSHVKPYYAFNPKISYEFKKNGQKLGVYVAINLNGNYKLSWLNIGAIYYPFKKLR